MWGAMPDEDDAPPCRKPRLRHSGVGLCCVVFWSVRHAGWHITERPQLLLAALAVGAPGTPRDPSVRRRRKCHPQASTDGPDIETHSQGRVCALTSTRRGEGEDWGVVCAPSAAGNADLASLGHEPRLEPKAHVLRTDFISRMPSADNKDICKSNSSDGNRTDQRERERELLKVAS